MKKFSWIVALLLALSFSAFFISCGVDPIEIEPPKAEYDEVPLDKGFNQWGGGIEKQMGWATAGNVSNEGNVAKDKGYKLDDFKAATRLVLELNDGGIKGGVKIIFGGAEGSTLGGWNDVKVAENDGKPTPGLSQLAGNVWTIYLDKVIGSKIGAWKASDSLKILIEYYTGNGTADLVKSAKLLIPTGFVAIEKIEFDGAAWVGYEFDLDTGVTFTPDNVTEREIQWSILGFTPEGGSYVAAPASSETSTVIDQWKEDYAGFIEETLTLQSEESYMDYTFLPPVKVVTTAEQTMEINSRNIVIGQQKGKLKVQATVLKGGKKASDGKDTDFITTFEIPVKELIKYTVDLSSAVNGGHTDAATVTATATKYTVTATTGNYEDNYAQFQVNLATLSGIANANLAKVDTIYFTAKGLAGDMAWKSPNIWVSNTKFSGRVTQADVKIGDIENGVKNINTAYDLSFTVTESMVKDTNNGSTVWISIMLNADKDDGTDKSSYEISDVSFTFKQ